MRSDMLIRIGSLWSRLNVRERRLAGITFAAVAFACLFTLFTGVRGTLGELDGNIERLQDDIVNYASQMAR